LGFEFDAELARDAVEVVRVPQHPLHWILDARAVRRAVATVVRRERVDAVLSYYAEAAFLPALLRRAGVRFGYIATWHSYAAALEGPLRAVPRWLDRRLKRRLVIRPHRGAEVLFATSRFTMGELASVLGVDRGRVVVCPLGVDPSFLEIEVAPAAPIRRLLFFGRIIESKGVLDALGALDLLARQGHGELELRLRGQGDHDWARRAARERGLEDRVAVLGPAGDDELRAELAAAQVAFLPSHFEAFGLAFAEAQAAGLPVVAYRAGSVPEVVEDGVTGWLAPPRDVAALARCLGEAALDPAAARARGLAGRERVRARFTWQQTARAILGGLRDAAVSR
jgi:glycosyltransferase involved in cell wall biosynthesis